MANLKIGDRVKFLNAVGGGKVSGIVSPKVVTVEDEQGFEIPCLITELVKDERFAIIPKPAHSTEKSASPKENRIEQKPKKESIPLFASSAGKPATANPSYYLAFVPEVPSMPLSGEIKAWLVNDSGNYLVYHFSLLMEGQYHSEKTGKLSPYAAIPLKGFSLEDFSNFPDFGIQIIPYGLESSVLLPTLTKTLKINPVKFYKETAYTPNPYFNKRAIILEIREKDLNAELEKLKAHDFNAPSVLKESGDIPSTTTKKPVISELREVDLHIQELVDSAAGMSNKEILDIQMERFRREMEDAIRGSIRRIVFIHGVGQGTLKNELRRELERKFPKYDVQDASFREYGYGATMVIIKRGQ
jgi:hypothetical protein